VHGRFAGDQLERVRERRLDQLEPVAAAADRAGKVDDQRLPANARDASAEQTVRRLLDGVCAECLGDPRHRAVENRLGRLGGEVPRRDPRPAGRQNEPRRLRELANRGGDLRTLVRDDAVLDVVVVGLEQLDEERAALVFPLAGGNAVRDGDDCGLQTGSFVFSTSVTSEMDMSLSIAFAMS
jgi:hypothetical protein